MRFIASMAWREIRASWRRLILFFFCIALGVAASATLRSFTRAFSESLSRDSRMLLSADVRVESTEAWTDEHRAVLEAAGRNGLVTGQSRMIETQTMVRAEQGRDLRPVMVDLRGIEPSFPLRGAIRLAGGTEYSHALLADRGALVSPGLLERLALEVGDRIVIGTTTFTVRGTIERMPGIALNFSPIPRVAVDFPMVEQAGLTGFGSRLRYNWLFAVAEGEENTIARSIGREYGSRNLRASIGTFHYIEGWLSGSLSNIEGFFSLIALSMVVLGGIGVASVTRVFVQQRVRTVAILKCLGGRTRRVVGAYLAQVLALSFAGGLLGLLLAQVLTSVIARVASSRLPIDLHPRLSPLASAQAVATGVLIALLFALPPLLDIRDIKPILVLRHNDQPRRRWDWLKLVSQLLLAGAIAALAGWQAGTYRDAGLFVGGIAATAIVLHLAGTILMWVLARLRRARTFTIRQGIASLHRPGNQTRVTLFTVGLGALFVIAVRLFQVNLAQEYALDVGGLSADMFLIDVQPAQHEGVETALASGGATDITLFAVTRARLVGIRRDPANPRRVPGNRIGGEFRLTHRAELESHETVVAGRFWPATPSDAVELSVESGYADWLRAGVGDVLIFEVAGRRFDAPITNIRHEERRVRSLTSLARADFVVRPGGLAALPHTYMGGAKGPTDVVARARLQNDVVTGYPGVTIVDALDEIEQIRRRVEDVGRAVALLGAFVLVCGVLILAGSVAMTKMHRLYESAVLKTLGAKRAVLVKLTIVEYAVLGVLAGVIGSAASIAVTWTMSHYGNRPLPWHLQPWINVYGAVATAIVVIIVGLLATWDVIVRKPLGILREQ
jgi:putative ABC transport system permease protein